MKKKTERVKTISEQINSGEIENLANVDWGKHTDWDNDKIKRIVDGIDGEAMKVAVLDCACEQFNYGKLGRFILNDKFGEYCQKLKEHIKNYHLYSVEAIKQSENEQIKQLQKEMIATQQCIISDELRNVLERGIEKEYIKECDNGKYKWLRVKRYLSVFAVEAHERGMTPNKFAFIETLFVDAKYLSQEYSKISEYKGNKSGKWLDIMENIKSDLFV